MSDITFSSLLFGSPVGVSNNNCYAAAIEYYRNAGDEKLQPGDIARAAGMSMAGADRNTNLSSCSDLTRKILMDAKVIGSDMTAIRPDQRCPAGHKKIMAVIAPGRDFHFYSYHRDLIYEVRTPRTADDLAKEFGVPLRYIDVPGDGSGSGIIPAGTRVYIRKAKVWSHKQGFSPDGPILKDACGKIIKDPRNACRNYGDLDYSKDCSAFCLRPPGR